MTGLPLQAYTMRAATSALCSDGSGSQHRNQHWRTHPAVRGLPPCDAKPSFFEDILHHSLTDGERKGCLLASSALETTPRDLGFGEMIAAALKQTESSVSFAWKMACPIRPSRLPGRQSA
jgi:hypothetical protein